MLPSLDDYPCKKSKRSIDSRYIVDQRIPQSDWMRGVTSQTKPKVVVSDGAFP